MAPRKKQQYSEEQMQSAINAVNNDNITVAKASGRYGIPKQTIRDRICKKYQRAGSGRPRELTQEEEASLVNYITFMAKSGHLLSIQQIKSFAFGIIKKRTSNSRFNDSGPGWIWWKTFRNRYSKQLMLRKPNNLDHGRSPMANQNAMDAYFKTLKETLEENGLENKPAHIFNCDESGINMGQRVGKVVVPPGTKHPYSEDRAPSDQITAHICCSATGQVLPPMIIFEKYWPLAPYVEHGPDGALYAKSENGYMNEELFVDWMKKIFIPHTSPYRPCILITDGHGSHITYAVTQTAIENNIIILLLPPHTTHILQPLDVGVLGAFKTNVSKVIDGTKLLSLTGNYSQINKSNFTAVFKLAFEHTMSLATIKDGFRKCGIYPFNPEAIDKSHLMPTIPASVAPIETSTSAVTANESAPDTNNMSLSSSPEISETSANSSMSSEIFERTMSLTTIKSGIYSFNPEAIDKSHLIPTIPASVAPIETSTSAVTANASAPDTNNMSLSSSPETSETTANPSMSSEILKYANIPQQLSDIFIIPVPSIEKKKIFRVVNKAKVITSDEYQLLLKIKREKKKLEMKKQHRKGRELKKLDKEQMKSKSKGKERAPKKKSNYKDLGRDSEDESIYLVDERESEIVDIQLDLRGRSKCNKAQKLIELLRKEYTDGEENKDENNENLNDVCATCFIINNGQTSEDVEWIYCDACEAQNLIELLRKEHTVGEESEDENNENLNDACATCFKENDGQTSKDVEWIYCDACEKWYHANCEKASRKDISADTYTCIKCSALLSEYHIQISPVKASSKNISA